MAGELGRADAFAKWTGQPRAWGDGGSVAFAGNVVEHVIAGLGADVDTVIGCVPWLTSMSLAKALGSKCCCIVVDKRAMLGDRDRGVRYLLSRDWQLSGLPIDALRRDQLGPRLTRRAQVDTYERVRIAGRTGVPERVGQLVHAKLLVAGTLDSWEHTYDSGVGEFTESGDVFVPRRAWIGSANFSQNASAGIEVGAWVTDRAFVDTTCEFLRDLILRYSEAPDSASDLPAPEGFSDIGQDYEPPDYLLDTWDEEEL